MPVADYTAEEIAQRGKEIYARDIQSQVEADHTGKIVIIDIETGEWEMDRDHLAAAHRAQEKRSDPVLFAMRVGFPTAYKIGGWGRDRK